MAMNIQLTVVGVHRQAPSASYVLLFCHVCALICIANMVGCSFLSVHTARLISVQRVCQKDNNFFFFEKIVFVLKMYIAILGKNNDFNLFS